MYIYLHVYIICYVCFWIFHSAITIKSCLVVINMYSSVSGLSKGCLNMGRMFHSGALHFSS
uniref:Uncharacterized protein n=1 Tax=Aquila chrysaetos chrysaetos TaxID=223781 RepID=A0A663EY68_AQUCH